MSGKSGMVAEGLNRLLTLFKWLATIRIEMLLILKYSTVAWTCS